MITSIPCVLAVLVEPLVDQVPLTGSWTSALAKWLMKAPLML